MQGEAQTEEKVNYCELYHHYDKDDDTNDDDDYDGDRALQGEAQAEEEVNHCELNSLSLIMVKMIAITKILTMMMAMVIFVRRGSGRKRSKSL